MSKKPSKERVSLLRILELAVEAIITDAAVNYPATGDPLDIEGWIRNTTRYVMGAVRRKDVPGHEPHKSRLTEDQKVKLLLYITGEKVTEVIEREQRQQRVELLMGMESPPAPKPPPESDPSQPHSHDLAEG